MSKINKLLRVLKNKGLKKLILISARYLYTRCVRPITPQIGHQYLNGVMVGDKKTFDVFFGIRKDDSSREGGIVSSQHSVVSKEDKVVIVGGGSGVTAVNAADIVGQDGSVTIYEGGYESFCEVKSTIDLNSVSARCEVKHAIVASDRNVYGGDTSSAEFIKTGEIPECDILELDCEGSEIDIIRELSFRPRAIISELHPWNYSCGPSTFLQILSDKGYKIEKMFGHDGRVLNSEEFNTLLHNSNSQGEKYLESGGRWPVVIAAIYEKAN